MSGLACNTYDCLHSVSRFGNPQAELDSFPLLFFMVLCNVVGVLVAPGLSTAVVLCLLFLPSFKLETTHTSIPDLASHITIQPQRGVLASSERSAQVHLLFHPKTELSIENKPILQCLVSCLGQAVVAHSYRW